MDKFEEKNVKQADGDCVVFPFTCRSNVQTAPESVHCRASPTRRALPIRVSIRLLLAWWYKPCVCRAESLYMVARIWGGGFNRELIFTPESVAIASSWALGLDISRKIHGSSSLLILSIVFLFPRSCTPGARRTCPALPTSRCLVQNNCTTRTHTATTREHDFTRAVLCLNAKGLVSTPQRKASKAGALIPRETEPKARIVPPNPNPLLIPKSKDACDALSCRLAFLPSLQ